MEARIRQDFPILDSQIKGEPLIYLDNAATSQKPVRVIQAITDYYQRRNANVHRGVHTLAEQATRQYEAARDKVAAFIGAQREEVIFTRGTTEGLNLIAAWAGRVLQAGDEVLITVMEHHANLIPWQEVCRQTGAKLVYAYLKDGRLDLVDFRAKLNSRTKFVSLAHVSNVLGCINPVEELASWAHQVGAYVVVDAAQSVGHLPVQVASLDCDFLVFSGHKMYGPTGVGVLYGKKEILTKFPPLVFGGEMIASVSEQEASWADLPYKFEAGTPPIAEAIGLGAAIDYLADLDMARVEAHERELGAYLLAALKQIEGLTLYGPTEFQQRVGVFSFNLAGLHPHDVATALDYQGIAVRAGHHCAQPLLTYLGQGSALRVSLALYNTKEDCQALIKALEETKEFFHGLG
ncbi:aminotransferase class V-fold PLP-dependent enzyme [Streptococcus cuniculipharyngis]|uniref:Cysteine desulfurase n=1 Tax=Streptococcus cuniculipharyngis TaxID=1562651 RepID=A0A5C5SBY2_9STRE|nr:cysteine desulfurase [Streptococcus cuniculipharyngis]TWS97432.1 cysteine desulfurase [Streptococcus cuniculipharyngis]